MMEENFYVYQHRVLGTLLRWGIGSSIVGALLAPIPGFWRHFGLQAVGWGTIDAALALAGRRQALRKAEAMASGDIDEQAAIADAERLRAILLVNAGLDLLYIGSGLWAARRYRDRADRRGLGVGIAVQGLYLLVFDTLFATDIERRWTLPNL